MKPRDRVFASLNREPFDRHPIKHLAVTEVEDQLRDYFGVKTHSEVLDHLGDDFREVMPVYRGPDFGILNDNGHVLSTSSLWNKTVAQSLDNEAKSIAEIKSVEELNQLDYPSPDWFDFSSLEYQCRQFSDYALILDYCGLDFINGISGLRGYEQTLMDIATRDQVFLELVQRRFEYCYEHYEKSLSAANGAIDFVHVADDFGT